MVDREFCSSDHRRKFRVSSARALRDAGEMARDYDDYLAVIQQPEKKQGKPGGSRFGMVTAAMIGLIIGLSMWFVPADSVPIQTGQLRYTLGNNPISQYVSRILPDGTKINLRQDFRLGAGDWLGGSASDFIPGSLRTENVRLWKPTMRFRDYQMEFQGVIEKRAMGWAFRASDLHNYYATKILLSGKDGSRAEIERFVMVGGRELERVRLPIPVSVRAETLYRVRVRVKGDQFSTSIDGQVIDSWRDRRLRVGGVGFVAEKGEQASVRWVSLSEPEGFWSRLLALGLLMPPGLSTPAPALPTGLVITPF